MFDCMNCPSVQVSSAGLDVAGSAAVLRTHRKTRSALAVRGHPTGALAIAVIDEIGIRAKRAHSTLIDSDCMRQVRARSRAPPRSAAAAASTLGSISVE